MPRHRYVLLDEEQLRELHEASLRVLEEAGVEIHHEGALKMCAEAGCRVDFESKIARIPASLVKDSLASAPAEVELYCSDGAETVRFTPGHVHFVPGTSAVEVIDWRTGKRRSPTSADTVELIRLADALDNIKLCAAYGVSDCPAEIWDRYRIYLMLRTSRKPFIGGAFTYGAIPEMAQLLEAAADGASQAAALHRTLVCGCPSPPLKWSELVVEGLMDCAERGIPFGILSMPGIGGTAPATVAGAIVQGHAEDLSGLVLAQLARPGAEIVHGCSPVLFDVRFGTMRGGAIEAMMLGVGLVELGRFVNLPTHIFLGYSDAKIYDQQGGSESAMGILMAALSGANCVFGPGMLYTERCMDYAKLVVDNELCGQALRLVRGVEVNEETLAVPEFSRVRDADALFMATEHTLRHFRSEAYLPGEVIDSRPLSEWSDRGEQDTAERARAVLERILGRERPEPLSAEAARSLDDTMRAIMRAHGVESLPLGP